MVPNVHYNRDDLKEFLKQIELSYKVIITTHINLDGDAIGSILALYHYLIKKNKEVNLISYTSVPENLKFVPGYDQIEVYEPIKHNQLIANSNLIIITDLNDIKRLNTIGEAILDSKVKKCIIDHHIDPKPFADFYLIDSGASSTCEIIYNLFSEDNSFFMTDEIALALYTGIMTDTGSFRFSNTNSEVFAIAAELTKYKIDPSKVYDEVYNNFSLNGLKLLGEAFSGLKTYYDGKLALMVLSNELFLKTKASEDDIENFAEEILCLRDAYVGILISEIIERNEIRVSFRSKGGYSVRDLAVTFGGGGHLQAAGARIYNMTLEHIVSEIIERAKILFN